MTGPADPTCPAAVARADQLAAAAVDAARDMDHIHATSAGEYSTGTVPPWIVAVADRVNEPGPLRVCLHLIQRGPQPVNVLAWSPDVRLCTPCARSEAIRTVFAPEDVTSSVDLALLSATCDACGLVLPDGITLSVIRPEGSLFILWAGLCDTCRADGADDQPAGDTTGA